MADMVPNSVPKGGMGGYMGNPSAQRPEKSWSEKPYDDIPMNDGAGKPVKIPGGGSRPF